MEYISIFYSSFSIILIVIIFAFRFFIESKTARKNQNLPPGPSPIPILGNLHLIKLPVHRTLYQLSQKYGPVFSLWFGSRFVTVVSSSSAVEECFTKNDVVLANRPEFLAGKHIGYNYSNMVSAPYGEHWRNLRRISALEILSTTRVNTFRSIRIDEVNQLLKKLSRDSLRGVAKVGLRPLFTELTFNDIMRMVTGKRFYGDDANDAGEAKMHRELMAEIMDVSQTSNPVDFLPILKWINYADYEKKLITLDQRSDQFLQNLIEEHRRKEEEDSKRTNTMIDHLLSLQESQPEYYTDQIIKGLVLVLFVAGTDTSAVTLEWAMAELLNRPDVLKKARAELDGEIGYTRLIDESDIPKLRYLQSIVHETLRLHPAIPLLLPHKASETCTIGGYNVPRDTIIFVNAWAIHRDPTVWDDPTSFNPERFDNGEDQAQKILSFGMGRRACPGAALAHRTLGLTLGSLIQCFDWERVGDKEIDMRELGGGITMPPVQPLEAMCKARPIMIDLLSQI
ncbi:hypothetical protein ACOSP7_023018 [Xanthoceras sorbifolium]